MATLSTAGMAAQQKDRSAGWRKFSFEAGMPTLGGAELLGGLIFSSIGFVAFVYGKRMKVWKSMLIGLALMAYPFFVSTDALLYSLGAVLTVALFVGRE